MSLVNKMLRDLDARHIGVSERAALPAAVTPLASRQAQKARPKAAWALIAILALAVVAAWQEFGGDVTTVKVAAAPVVPAPVPRPAVAPVVAPAPAATSSPPATQPAPTTPAAKAEPDRSAAAPDVLASAAKVDAASAPSTLRMAAELSVVPPSAPGPTPKPVAPAEKRSTAKPMAAAAVSQAPTAGKAVPAKAGGGAPAAAEPAKPVPAVPEMRIEKQERVASSAERAESEFRRAVAAQRQGNGSTALAGYRSALELSPEHAGARQALAARLIDARRYDEAEEVLRKGIEIPSLRLSSTMALARLKVEQNQASAALDLLHKNAAAGESSAEFQGFTAALLNRAGRSAEAAERLAPAEGRWWAGLGIALDATGKAADAREAYQRARLSPDLPADLALHVDQRLR